MGGPENTTDQENPSYRPEISPPTDPTAIVLPARPPSSVEGIDRRREDLDSPCQTPINKRRGLVATDGAGRRGTRTNVMGKVRLNRV